MARLLLFFDTLTCYLPAEPEGVGTGGIAFLRNIYRQYAPAPLGRDLPRFNRLVRDMTSSRPEEFSRLFAAARTHRHGDSAEISADTLYGALQKDAQGNAGMESAEQLWQARLLLKLAELLDRRGTEVQQGLAQVSSLEKKLFADLEGPDGAETDLEDLASIAAIRQPEPEAGGSAYLWHGTPGLLMGLRLKAWAQLYMAAPPDTSSFILASASPEAGALILDGYENIYRRNPVQLISLALPSLSPLKSEEDWTHYLGSRKSFRDAVQDHLEYFACFLRNRAALTAPPADARQEDVTLRQHISGWQHRVKTHFPGKATGAALTFYTFPGTSPARLLQRIFRLKKPAAADSQSQPSTLLALLTPGT